MTEQSRRSFLRHLSVGGAVVGGAVAGAAALTPTLLARPTAFAGPGRGVATPGMEYSVDLNMSAQTVGVLTSGLYQLLVFKVVQSAAPGGVPVLWGSIGGYSEVTRLSWTAHYYAFASTQQISRQSRLAGAGSMPIAPGQTLDVGPGAVGTVVDGGRSADTIRLRNTTVAPFSCGVAQPSPNGGPTMPLCAFPLSGRKQVSIKPLEKVALVFASGPPRPGSVVRSSVGPTVLVDLGRANAAELTYDIDAGWSWDGEFAEAVPSGAFAGSLVVGSPGGS